MKRESIQYGHSTGCAETTFSKWGPAKIGVAVFVFAIFCLSASAKDRPRETVTVVANESTTTAYDWQMDGRASVSCYGSSCSMYYRPASSGTQAIQGAILRLKRSDESVVIAQCVGKPDVVGSVVLALGAVATNDSEAPTVYRNCRIPEANSIVEVEFYRSQAKIVMRAPSVDGTGKVSSETYYIKGVLRPSTQTEQTQNASVQSAPANSPASDLQRLEITKWRLEEWYRNWQGLSDKVDNLGKSCPPPITDESCFRAVREYFLEAIPVFEAGVPLVEERMALLNTLNQDAAAKQSEDETSKLGEGMRQAVLTAKTRLADLDARLAAVAKPTQVYREQPASTVRLPAQPPAPQLSEAVLKLPSPMNDNPDLMRVDKSIADSHSDSAPVPHESDAVSTEMPTKQVTADAQQKVASCPKGIKIGMSEGDVYSCKGVPAQRSGDQAFYSDGTIFVF